METPAAGTPCVVVNSSALKEWIDDVNCLGIDCPIDSSKLASMICHLSGQVARGLKFNTWDESTEEVLAVYRRQY
jgi:hypothetical protein